jgi:hypothetical protein
MKLIVIILISFLVAVTAGTASAYTPEDCIDCHGEKSQESALRIPVKVFQESIHAIELTCLDCHTNVVDDSHEETIGSGGVDCVQCHEKVNHHGLQGLGNRPKCYSCHTRHRIFAREDERSPVNPQQLRSTCQTCHPVECGQTDYLSFLPSLQLSSHKKQDFGRNYSRSNCIGCHQGMASHGKDEIISEQNCHKCHSSRQGESLLMGYIHSQADPLKQSVIFSVAVLYQVAAVILLIGGFGFFIRMFAAKSKKGK